MLPSTLLPLFLQRKDTTPKLMFEPPHGLGEFGLWVSVQPVVLSHEGHWCDGWQTDRLTGLILQQAIFHVTAREKPGSRQCPIQLWCLGWLNHLVGFTYS